jgi:hypothetical protein
MAERSYTTANWRGCSPTNWAMPVSWSRPEDPADPKFWAGRRVVLRAGACIARAAVELAGYPEEVDAYRAEAGRWLLARMSVPEGRDLDRELRQAQEYCVRQGPDFVNATSEEGGMWDLLMTDFMRVVQVMDS